MRAMDSMQPDFLRESSLETYQPLNAGYFPYIFHTSSTTAMFTSAYVGKSACGS